MSIRSVSIVCACLMLAACSGDKPATSQQQAGASLPLPGAQGGSVTGMPNPGMPSSRPVLVEGIPTIDEEPGVPASPVTAEQVEAADALMPAPGDGTDAAIGVLRDYYVAINARDYARAFANWSDGGRASGQSPQQFVDGFAETEGVSVAFGEPGRIEGAAGSHYIEIPVTVDATQLDGSTRHFIGKYTLRMTVVDGASPAQRTWHIASANLAERQPSP